MRSIRPTGLLLAGLLLTVLGCSSGGPPTAGPTDATSGPGTSTAPAPDPSATAQNERVTYAFAVPGSPVTVTNPNTAPDLPHLVGVTLDDNGTFQRVAFAFSGAVPSYRFSYVPAVTQDATGDPVPLAGAYFVSVVFIGAQAHDDAGNSTVGTLPSRPVGMSLLRDVAPAGDFEGQVSYGVGVTEPGDGPPQVRAGEYQLAGAGGLRYVVYLDFQA